jgi:hypothetical protein
MLNRWLNTDSRRLNFILFGLVILFFILSRAYCPLYCGNQNEYYLHAFARTHPDLLQNDWFVQTQPKHIVFSYLVELLYRLNIVQLGSNAIQMFLEGTFYISIYLIAQTFFSSLNKRKHNHINSRILALVPIIGLLLLRDSSIAIGILVRLEHFIPGIKAGWEQFWDLGGIAGQFVLGTHLLASEFGILIILGIALSLRDYWRTAAVLFAIATIFNFGYFVQCAVLMLIFAGWLIYQKRPLHAFQICVIFGLLVLPVFLYALTFLGDPQAALADEINSTLRQPHHSIPSFFWGGILSWNTWKMVVLVLGILACIRYRFHFLAVILSIGFTTIVASLLYVHFSSNYSVAIQSPWRASAYLIPLSTVVLIVIMTWLLSQIPNYIRLNRLHLKGLMTVGLLFAVCIEFLIFVNDKLPPSEPTNQDLVYAAIAEATEPDDVILVSAGDNAFLNNSRLGMKRPIYIDEKATPYKAPEFMEFWRRNEFLKAFSVAPLREQFELCKEEDIDYFVTYMTDDTLDIAPIVAMDPYYLYRCE